MTFTIPNDVEESEYELEITVGNHDNMELRGFNLSTEITAGAAGSAELSIAMRDRVMAAQLALIPP